MKDIDLFSPPPSEALQKVLRSREKKGKNIPKQLPQALELMKRAPKTK